MTRHCLLGKATLIQSPWLWLATMTLGKWFDSLSVFIPVMIQKGRGGEVSVGDRLLPLINLFLAGCVTLRSAVSSTHANILLPSKNQRLQI